MDFDMKPLLLSVIVVDTLLETASQQNAFTLGGAKPNQASELEGVEAGNTSTSLQKDLEERA